MYEDPLSVDESGYESMDASFPPTREAGLARLADFVKGGVLDYQRLRNYDRGPSDRANVSTLSPYVSRRLVRECEVLEHVLSEHSYAAVGRFVDEVFWRTYYKGWLEHRPSVWASYRNDVASLIQRLEADPALLERYEAAVSGRTGLDCFDVWVEELAASGYLHNHARMWFASIWVFTLGLPWQLGADFMYRHLIDGDAASNTLSWRWVCGLHTRGKTYLARASNIARCTGNRFNPRGLSASAEPIVETTVHLKRALPIAEVLPAGARYGLLVTEEDCHPESLPLAGRPEFVVAFGADDLRSPLPTSELPRRFIDAAVADALSRAAERFEAVAIFCDYGRIEDALLEACARHDVDTLVTAYAPVGPVAARLASASDRLAEHRIRLIQTRRGYDNRAWPHATAGYFRLKSKIPTLLDRLCEEDSPEQREAS